VFAAETAGVGPMAAVAGALSQYVGTALAEYTDEMLLKTGRHLYEKKADAVVVISKDTLWPMRRQQPSAIR